MEFKYGPARTHYICTLKFIFNGNKPFNEVIQEADVLSNMTNSHITYAGGETPELSVSFVVWSDMTAGLFDEIVMHHTTCVKEISEYGGKRMSLAELAQIEHVLQEYDEKQRASTCQKKI